MAAINFPNAPEINELFSVGARTWKWTGTVWQTVTTETGSQGDKAGHRYEFSADTVVSQPSNGFIKFNNSAVQQVTTISLSNLTKTDVNIANFLNDLDSSDSVTKFYLTISSNNNYDPTFTVFRVAEVTVNSVWTELSVLYISGTSPSNGEQIVLNYDRTGDRGPTGPTGPIGPTGPTNLPSYTGNDGKFLTTDGLTAFWENVDALPLQTGNSGKYLTTDGTEPSWEFLAGAVYQNLEPTGPLVGQIWVDSDATASVLNTNDFLLKTDAAAPSGYLLKTDAAGPSGYLLKTDAAGPTGYLSKTDTEPILTPIGSIMTFAGSASPSSKWAICDGTAVSRTTYASLFSIIGTTYGVGDGSTTFNLPNLKGRTVVGVDAAQTEFDALGETGGAKTHTLTSSEIPSHTHPITDPGHAHTFVTDSSGGSSGWGGVNSAVRSNSYAYTAYPPTSSNGTGITVNGQSGTIGQAHNNLQPYIAMNYIIRVA